MSQVIIEKSTAWVLKKNGRERKPIQSLQEALSAQADCSACGCDDCLGYWTNINTSTGDLVVLYVKNVENVATLIIEPYDEGIVNLKALKAARD